MDRFFKKYFWLINLIAVGLCAGLGGRAASHVIEQNFLLEDDQGQNAPVVRHASLSSEKTRNKEIERIVSRNIFCANCAPPVPEEDKQAVAAMGNNDPVKTTLSLELVSTMYVPDDDRWSMAVIRDSSTKEKDALMYNRGKLLPSGAKVLRVDPRKVFISNGGRVEFLELEGGGDKRNESAYSSPVMASSVSGDPIDNEVQRGVRCNGAQCDIDRPLVDKLLSNTTALATAARFVPSVKDGRPNGFKLYAIRPSSIFGKIGMQNGDTVKSINGMEMSSPDQALGVYTKLRSASHLTVNVERHGENVTLDYTIR